MPCRNSDCAYDDTGECARGVENPEAACPDLIELVDVAPPPTPESGAGKVGSTPTRAEAAPSGAPWSGLALGSEEIPSLWLSRSPALLTLVGGEEVGKTCYLVALYLTLANGWTADFPYRFAGSRSLLGFDRLAWQTWSWDGREQRALQATRHPSHREPSFLHLALASRRGRPRGRDLLLTDLPGEWFHRWVGDEAEQAVGTTLDFLPSTSGYLFLVDAPRLLDDKLYARDVRYLCQRFEALWQGVGRGPLALVLTKLDQLVNRVELPSRPNRRKPRAWGPLRANLEMATDRLGLNEGDDSWDIFPTSALPGRPEERRPLGVLEPLAFLLDRIPTTLSASDCCPRPESRDCMRLFRKGGRS